MNYDLNLNSYTRKELLEFFHLQENYDSVMINAKKRDLISITMKDDSKDEHTKKTILNFIDDAANKLGSYTLINNSTMLTDVENSNVENYKISRVPSNNNTMTTEHPIVNKPYTPFYYSNPSTAFDGVVNPLERRIITKVLSIDSIYRKNYCFTNSNSFTIELAAPLNNVIHMRLISLELPKMWYSISSELGNNTLSISLYDMANYENNTQTIVIPDGNYSNQLLITMINNYFSNIGMGLDYLRFNINPSNSKAIFYVKSDPSVDTILPYDSSNSDYSPNFYYTIRFHNNKNDDDNNCETNDFGKYLGYEKSEYVGTKNNNYVDNFFTTPSLTYYGVIIG
jgi:hypothetical protein